MTLYFFARVRLDRTPRALPFMSAEVRFDTGRVENALAIPAEAMTLADGRRCCYVVGPSGLERRVITIGHTTTGFLEVTDGLEEGEQVVSPPGARRPRGDR